MPYFPPASVGGGTERPCVTVGYSNADYIVDGTADNVQIQQAIDAVASTGGKVFIKRGTYNLAAKLQITTSHMAIEGEGNSTILTLANNVNDNVLNITGTGVIECKVKMLRIDGNKANQTNGDGIYVSTPWTSGTNDTQHSFEDIQILNCKNNGFEVAASSDTRVLQFNRVRIRKCDGNGWYLPAPSCTDSTFYDCIAETMGLNGFYIGCLNSHFTDCKAFYCGSDGGNTHGFHIVGYNNYFTTCEAQDNYQSGFYGDGTAGDATYHNQGCTFVNCTADSNNQNANASYGAGFQLASTLNWQIIGGITMTRPWPSFTQRAGVFMTGTTTGTMVIGLLFEGNTTAWSDTSSGSNYRMLCKGQSMESSTLAGTVSVGTDQLVGRASTDTLTNKTLTSPKINEFRDTNGNMIMNFNPVTSAVNYIRLDNNATGAAPVFVAVGTDTNIGIDFIPKNAGRVRINSENVPSVSSTDTLTNKRITKRTGTTTSSATPTINTDNVDFYSLTAQTADITSFTTNLSGTPTEGQTLWIAITGTAARAITWGSSFESSTVTLPTTTVTTNRLDVGFIWNTVTSKWRCIAAA